MTSEVNSPLKGAPGRLFLALATAVLAACASESELVVQGEAQGSTFVVRAYGDSLNLSESDVARWLADYNKAVSAWDPQSELSRLNRGEVVATTPVLNELLLVAEGRVHHASLCIGIPIVRAAGSCQMVMRCSDYWCI